MARPANYFPPMRREMTVYRPNPTPSQNTAGEDIAADEVFLEGVRCAKEPDTGDEQTEANQQQGFLSWTIFLRARADLTTAMYGVIDGKTYNFNAIIPPMDNNRVVLRIKATERVN